MKIDRVKLLFSIAISLLLGFLCQIIAPETDNRNWISFGIASISIFCGLLAAICIVYDNERRGVSIKTLSWLLTICLILSNGIFSAFEYNIKLYIAINLFVAVFGWLIIYSLTKAE